MKTRYGMIRSAALAFAAAVITFGCAKESGPEGQTHQQDPSGECHELTVEVAGRPSTKTVISGPDDENKLPVRWAEDDKLYVVNESDGYIGCLSWKEGTEDDGAIFKGTLTGWTTTDILHIYYLGKLDSAPAAKASEFTFDIGAQGGTRDWIAGNGQVSHYATTDKVAPGNRTVGSEESPAAMENLNAVVLFNLSGWTGGTTISGTFGSAVLDLKKGGFTTKTGGGIALSAEACTDSTYVSLIPGDGDMTLTFKKGSYSTPVRANTVAAGCFYSNNGKPIDVPMLEKEGALPGIFTVSAEKKVCFSKGNLQAEYSSASSSYIWGFAEHQYDYVGNAPGNTTIGSQSDGNVVDLFGWSTSANSYGISTSENNDTYAGDFIEWGKAIDGNGTWRTLTGGDGGEWKYLLSTREVNGGTGKGHSYQRATVNSVYGLIIYPDGYTSQTDAGSYDREAWETMEDGGCVFLPAAGYRHGTSFDNVGTRVSYWSSSSSGYNGAYRLVLSKDDTGDINPTSSDNRFNGFSVRLVTDTD